MIATPSIWPKLLGAKEKSGGLYDKGAVLIATKHVKQTNKSGVGGGGQSMDPPVQVVL
jgi:hypothetical protein